MGSSTTKRGFATLSLATTRQSREPRIAGLWFNISQIWKYRLADSEFSLIFPYIRNPGSGVRVETRNFQIVETQAASLEDLGRLIRRKRKASKLRIDDAAALCRVSVGTLSRLETGKAAVSAEKVLQVMDRLGLVMLVLDREKLSTVVPVLKRTDT